MRMKIANSVDAMTSMIKFIGVWQNADTIVEVQQAYGITQYCAYNYRAALERQAGVRLKNFKRPRTPRLSDGAIEILKQEANSQYMNYIRRTNNLHENT